MHDKTSPSAGGSPSRRTVLAGALPCRRRLRRRSSALEAEEQGQAGLLWDWRTRCCRGQGPSWNGSGQSSPRCELGSPRTAEVAGMFPNAARYRDFRKMFDEKSREFDAVAIATPDFSHFPIAMQSMAMGKHIYCESRWGRASGKSS
ncbi:Gfo/Idh/MocA family oxidoreductase [Caulobacter segnis]